MENSWIEILKPLWARKGRDIGERSACAYLHQKGYRIIERNFAIKWAEIDIIATTNSAIIFIEVKRRGSEDFGTPGQAVNRKKQHKIKMAAQIYLQKNKIEKDVRFDVVEVHGKSNEECRIVHIENAF